jgi:S1-C subfamily serine protease
VRSRRDRAGLAVGLALALAGTLAVSAAAVVQGQRHWAARLASERVARQELERGLAATRARLDALAGELATTAALLRARAAGPAAAAPRVREAAGDVERVLARRAAGVALVQATVGYVDGEGRPFRYRVVPNGAAERELLGSPAVGVDDEGPPVTTTFLGSGFLVDEDGTLMTSRHVVRPWEGADEAELLQAPGMRPHVTELRAFFPGRPEPVALTEGRASEAADVMLLRAALPPGAVPALPLERAPAVPGRPVVVLGYPGGLERLLARVEPETLRTLVEPDVREIADETVDVGRLLVELARRRVIRPHASWGHVVEVRPHLITYDARIAIGASGGPILDAAGRVVGVSHAVLSTFDGVAFAIPIRHGVGLLRGRPLPP